MSNLISYPPYDPTSQKLTAYRFHYRAPDRTLKAEEVDAAHQKVLEALTSKAGVSFTQFAPYESSKVSDSFKPITYVLRTYVIGDKECQPKFFRSTFP